LRISVAVKELKGVLPSILPHENTAIRRLLEA
jgi:hypothetical protein